ncbi:MAG: TIGR00266 family protein, partial [Streptococcaceae bacterium]|nr:TIGR00266 family protein [Streptococcaceae bacterium]
MRYELDKNDAFPSVKINMNQGETMRIQSGSMVYRQGGVELSAKLNKGSGGGLFSAVARSVTSGESMFLTEVSAPSAPGIVVISPELPGQIVELEVGAEQYCLNDKAFLAMDDTVNYQMVRQKLSKAVFSGQGGLFVMETTGQGTILINAFGSLDKIELDGTQEITIDNNHVIAWDRTLDFNIHFEGKGFFSSIGTGEGLVNTFRGRGTIYLQTLNIESFAKAVQPYIQV